MKLIESPLDKIILRWDTGDGEIWIELTPTDEGIEVYCDGEGMAEFDCEKDSINTVTIKPRLMI